MDFENSMIDPVKYGVLWERVQVMDKKIDKMEAQIDQLLELANKSKGGFWLGISIMSGLSALIGFALSHFK